MCGNVVFLKENLNRSRSHTKFGIAAVSLSKEINWTKLKM